MQNTILLTENNVYLKKNVKINTNVCIIRAVFKKFPEHDYYLFKTKSILFYANFLRLITIRIY